MIKIHSMDHNGKVTTFSYNGKADWKLKVADLKYALKETVQENLELKRQLTLQVNLSKERLFGLDAAIRKAETDRLMEQLNPAVR